eukprot:CAMPEP_0168477730 /NCGR_PEP_ID=MMETSP0228-20121227/62568_1 /TAXON_ID=133427 /ORGANISM="Protoceratium reticulatum, Strain CCCM 535 (=CCMP 1889)" /LENGTH=266 /DNA_ID=CAMNT_0008493919 /DNA_START=45 /DNA_END=846 /DNA_ORIENTATION=+
MTLEISPDYGIVVAAAGAIGLSQLFISAGVMSLRSKLFKSKDFLEKQAVKDMREAHKKAFQSEMNDLGYPDMGCEFFLIRAGPTSWAHLMTLEITPDYGIVVAAAGAMGLAHVFIGGAVMSLRAKLFKSKEFLEKQAVKDMKEAHKKAFQSEMNDMGYPDMGCGLYAQQLEYHEWVEFNNAQRAHYNMIEASGFVLASMLGAGLRFPKPCGILGFVFTAGRLLYARGYMSRKGADGRIFGALVSAGSGLSLYFLAFIAGALAFARK